MKAIYLSPLRYPGSKRKFVPHINKMLQMFGYANAGYTLVEPCCGGASTSLYLLNNETVSSSILIDKDPWVASFWQMLFQNTDQLVDDIRNIDVTVEQWLKMRETPPKSLREEALYCFFFNRTCYSGILHGGMIGGNQQKSKYKINCRFNKPELIDRIKFIAEIFSDKVKEIHQASVFDILDQATTKKYKDRIYYIDPPYVKKGQRLYPHNFDVDEHRKLQACLKNLDAPWLLSYHDHDLVNELYKNDDTLDNVSFDMWWVADHAQKGTELFISNFSLLTGKKPMRNPVQESLWNFSIESLTDQNPHAVEKQALSAQGD